MTPYDIQKHVFTTSFRGYDKNDVNDFFSRVSREYEDLYQENKRMKQENSKLKDQIKDYENIEKTLKETLISVQKASGDIHGRAEKEAELVVKESELKADKIIEIAQEESKELLKQIRYLRKQKKLLKIDLKSVIQSYIQNLDLVEKKVEKKLIVDNKKTLEEQEKNILKMRRKMLKSPKAGLRKKTPILKQSNNLKTIKSSVG